MSVPALRFKEFSTIWKFKKFLDVTDVLRCGIASTPIYVKKGVPFLSAQNVSANGHVVLDKYNFISEEFYKKISKNNELMKGDLLYSRVGASYGNAAVFELAGRYGVYVSLTHIRPNENLNNYFLMQYLNSNKGKEQAKNGVVQGGGVPNLNVKVVEKFNIPLPAILEQTKIANFLTAVDEKITHLTQKHDLLTQYKKGVMQKIFSQELRFKDDDGQDFPEWEDKVLADISVKKSSNIAANKIEENEGDYKIYGASGVLKKVDFFTQSLAYISIVKDGAGVGRVFLCEPKTSVLGTMDIIQPKENVDISFLNAVLEQIDFVIYVTGSTIPHIYYKDYSKEEISVPSLKEQTKIATFLTAIDDKITATQTQLQAVKQYKQGLLQQMFV